MCRAHWRPNPDRQPHGVDTQEHRATRAAGIQAVGATGPRGVGGGRQQRLRWGARCGVLGERAWAGKHLGLGVLSRATRPPSAGSAQLPTSFPRAGRLPEKSLSGHQQPWDPLPQGDHVPGLTHGLCANLWMHWPLRILTTKKSASLGFPKPTDRRSYPDPRAGSKRPRTDHPLLPNGRL